MKKNQRRGYTAKCAKRISEGRGTPLDYAARENAVRKMLANSYYGKISGVVKELNAVSKYPAEVTAINKAVSALTSAIDFIENKENNPITQNYADAVSACLKRARKELQTVFIKENKK